MLAFAAVRLAVHPGAYFITVTLENACWHIPTDLGC